MVKQWSLLGFRGRRQVDHGVETSCVSMFLPSRFYILFQVGYSVMSLSVSSLCQPFVSSLLCLVHKELEPVTPHHWYWRFGLFCLLGCSVCLPGQSCSSRSWGIFFCPWRKASWWHLKSYLKCWHFLLSVEIVPFIEARLLTTGITFCKKLFIFFFQFSLQE